MILARLMKAVREQNWLAVAIEFVIVVAGVLLAFQITAWREAHAESARATDYTERLLTDLRVERAMLMALDEYYRQVEIHAERAITAMETGTVEEPDQFLIDAYQASQVDYGRSARATITEMVSNGGLGLIEDVTLRTRLMDYFSDDGLDGLLFTALPAYRASIREIIPFGIQDRIRDECGDRYISVEGIAVFTLPESCPLEFAAERAGPTVQRILAETDIHADLRVNLAEIHAKRLELQQLILESESIVRWMETSE